MLHIQSHLLERRISYRILNAINNSGWLLAYSLKDNYYCSSTVLATVPQGYWQLSLKNIGNCPSR